MLINYLKVAFRNILRNKAFSFINIVGLAAGLAVSFCIIIYITHELSYDKHLKNYDSIYRVDSDWKENNFRIPLTSIPLAPEAKERIPGVEAFARMRLDSKIKVIYKENKLDFDKTYFTDPSVLNIFSLHLKYGNSRKAFSDPQSIVLSEETALKIFGKANVLGEFLKLELDTNSVLVKVTGILKKQTLPATLNPDILIPIKIRKKLETFKGFSEWRNIQSVTTYLLLNKNVDIRSLEKQLKIISDNGMTEMDRKVLNITFHVVPLSRTYYTKTAYPFLPKIDSENILIYSGIAILIMLLACINFIILTTAKSSIRNTEMGVRKVIGAQRKDIALLLIIESIFTSLLAFPLALIFIELLIPYFEEIINRTINPDFYVSFSFLTAFLLVTILAGFLSGLYSAFSFARTNPAEILRRRFTAGNKKINLKRILISFQMIAFISLIIVSIVLKSQLELTHKKDMGFDINNFLTIDCYSIQGKTDVFKNSLGSCPGIADMAYTTGVFPYARGNRFRVSDFNEPAHAFTFGFPLIGYDYPRLVNMKLVKGKFPTKEDYKNKVLLNETAVRVLGLKSPVGKKILVQNVMKEEIIGVVKDFNLNSLHDKIRPVAMQLGNYSGYLVIKYSPGQLSRTINFIKAAWAKVSNKPVDITFMDKKIDSMYGEELRFSKAINLFTGIAILIGAMGLFGVVLFSTKQRLKEIGIRKILGASVYKILGLVLKEILVMIIISATIASPVAYYFMNKWLQDFAYKINISWWMFILAGGIALLIALVVVGFQAIKAATSNPVKSLRYE